MAITAAWTKCDKLTVDKTKYSGTVNNFPALFTAANLNPDIFTDAKAGGADIRFSSDAAGANELAFEINIWDAAATACVIFCNIGTITTSTNPIVYIWYGNPAASAYAETDTYGKHKVWDSNFKMVQHLTENGTGQAIDSTSNSVDSASRTAVSTQTAPLFYRSASFTLASSQYIGFGNVVTLASSPCTLESWFNSASIAAGTLQYTVTKGFQYFQLFGRTAGSVYYDDLTLYTSTWNEAYVLLTAGDVGSWQYNFGSFGGHPGTIANWNNLNSGVTIASSGAIAASTSNLNIGASSVPAGYFNGKIQEVRISNIQRSTAYREATYRNISSPATFSAWEAVSLVPAAPVHSSPADGATECPITQAVAWLASAGASSYGLQVDDDSGFGSPLVNVSGLTALSYSNSGLNTNTPYYWRVNATSGGGTSDWSAAWSFTTVNIPAARTQIYPGDGMTVPNQPVAFAWTA